MLALPGDGKSAGEVVVRAPWPTRSYLNIPQATEMLWEGDWLHTQDVGNIDKRGYLKVTDRIEDAIRTGGTEISSPELEDLIARHPGVSKGAVMGVPDQKWGERPFTAVVLKPNFTGKAREEDIRAHLGTFVEGGHVSKCGVPKQMNLVSELARTSGLQAQPTRPSGTAERYL